MASKSKPATTAAKVKDAPRPKDAPKAKDAPAKAPAKPQPHAPAKPAAIEARPLFVDEAGKTLSGAMAVLAVLDRFSDEEAAEVRPTGRTGELAGMPKLLGLIGTFPTSSHTTAAKLAREAGLLGADQDAVTLTARFVSAVDVPAAEAEVPPTAAPEMPEPPRAA